MNEMPQVCGPLRRRKSQALEGDRDGRDVTRNRSPRRDDLPDRVEAEIIILSLGDDAIELDPERRHQKHVGPLAIVERVEKHADKIIVENRSRRFIRARTFDGSLAWQTNTT